MKPKSETKYDLRDLHADIDLYDRKITHCEKYEHFESEADRATALAKLVAKRALLAKSALAMVASGVEYDTSTLPRSLKQAPTTSQESL
jgi:hypothetical protein